MDPKDTRRLIKRRMGEIARKKIFEHAVKIVYDLGRIHRTDRGSFTETKGSFAITCRGLKLEIELDTTGQFKENKEILIWVNGVFLFEARETSFPESENQDRLVRISGGRSVYIGFYHPGPWTRLIDPEKMKSLIKRSAKLPPKTLSPAAKKPVRPRGPLTDQELRLASDLGIN